MSAPQTPVFGKRNRPAAGAAPPAFPSAPVVDHAALFAAARAEIAAAGAEQPRFVPRSFTAAFLAGLVVGCGLVGLDIAGIGKTAQDAQAVAAALDPSVPTGFLVPSLILVGVIGGGRAAATSLLVGHALLAKAGLTSHVAYMAGGVAAALAFAAALALVTGQPPAHGWLIEAAAGAAAGFCYRLFAGMRPLETTA